MFQLTDDLEKWIQILLDKGISIQIDYYHRSTILTEEWKKRMLN